MTDLCAWSVSLSSYCSVTKDSLRIGEDFCCSGAANDDGGVVARPGGQHVGEEKSPLRYDDFYLGVVSIIRSDFSKMGEEVHCG